MKFPKPLPQSNYGDPSLHVKFEQETCKGCRHTRVSYKPIADVVYFCAKIGKKWGRRCGEYRKG